MMDTKKNRSVIINSIIGLVIMFGFQLLPISLPEVTSVGMMVLGVFLGTLYLWSTVDPLWASIMAVVALGFLGYDGMSNVLISWMGNAVVVQTLFMMVIGEALHTNGVTTYMARFFLTRKSINGKPWLFTFVICLGCFLISAFVSAWAPIFIFWPVLYDVFQEVGYEKGEKYPTIAVILVAASTLLGFPVPPYMGNILLLIGNYATLTAELPGGAVLINSATYLCTVVLLGIVLCAALVLVAKFILRPDVERLKNINIDMLKEKNPLPPMSVQQKVLSWGFVVLVVLLLLPCVLPKTIGWVAFLSANSVGLCVFACALLGALRIQGKPAMDLPAVVKNISWSTYFMCATAIYLGGALTSADTGITAFLSYVLNPMFSSLSPIAFTIIFLLAGFILTNICNSLVIAILMQPVLAAFAASSGMDTTVVCMLMMYTILGTAFITPAASPFSAILFSNKEWLVNSRHTYTYTAVFSVTEMIIVLALGIPLATGFVSLIG